MRPGGGPCPRTNFAQLCSHLVSTKNQHSRRGFMLALHDRGGGKTGVQPFYFKSSVGLMVTRQSYENRTSHKLKQRMTITNTSTRCLHQRRQRISPFLAVLGDFYFGFSIGRERAQNPDNTSAPQLMRDSEVPKRLKKKKTVGQKWRQKNKKG